MRVLGIIAAACALFGAAHAATVSIENGDFEAAKDFTNSDPYWGDWGQGAEGWTLSGSGGVWAPGTFTNFYTSAPASLDDQIGFLNQGGTLSQDLGITVQSGVDYTLSAMFGDRLGFSFGGVFGFYVGDVSNVIASTAIVSAGDGLWGLQEFTVLATLISTYVGQDLGIFFTSNAGQLNFDNVDVRDNSLRIVATEQVLVNPIPGAAWLFGTAIFGGAFASRRKKRAV